MNHRGLLKHTALIFISFFFFNIHWKIARCAPTQASCTEFDSTKSLTELIHSEAELELTKYVKIHFNGNVSSQFTVRDDAPNSTILGVTTHEKLQDIYSKNVLFQSHLEKVKEYEETVWSGNLSSSLSELKDRLSHHKGKIEILIGPPFRPPTLAPLQLSHTRDIIKKIYGWSVLRKLNEWIIEVLQLLKEINPCESRDAGF